MHTDGTYSIDECAYIDLPRGVYQTTTSSDDDLQCFHLSGKGDLSITKSMFSAKYSSTPIETASKFIEPIKAITETVKYKTITEKSMHTATFAEKYSSESCSSEVSCAGADYPHSHFSETDSESEITDVIRADGNDSNSSFQRTDSKIVISSEVSVTEEKPFLSIGANSTNAEISIGNTLSELDVVQTNGMTFPRHEKQLHINEANTLVTHALDDESQNINASTCSSFFRRMAYSKWRWKSYLPSARFDLTNILLILNTLRGSLCLPLSTETYRCCNQISDEDQLHHKSFRSILIILFLILALLSFLFFGFMVMKCKFFTPATRSDVPINDMIANVRMQHAFTATMLNVKCQQSLL